MTDEFSEVDAFEPVEEDIEDIDPFSTENAPKVALIVQMRIYDAVMALLNEKDPEAAAALHEIHAAGKVLGSLPFLDLTED